MSLCGGAWWPFIARALHIVLTMSLTRRLRLTTPPCIALCTGVITRPKIKGARYSANILRQLVTKLAILSPFLLCITPDKGSVANECMNIMHSHFVFLGDVCRVYTFRYVCA